MSRASRAARAALLSWVLVAIAPAAMADEAAEYQKLAADRSKPLVTVKFVLKMKMGGFGDQETDQEITGAMIEPTGLVLVANSQIGGVMGMARRFMSGMGELSITPTDIKVLVGDDSQGVEAELMARDTDLDLAWIKIKDAKGKTFDYVDLSKAGKATVGQRLLSVVRLGKYFDRVCAVQESRVSAITKKPRELYVPASGVVPNGLPVYSASGEIIGVSVSQAPDSEESDGMGAMLGMTMNDLAFQAFILPTAEVVKATARAKEAGANKPVDDEASEGKEEKKESATSKPKSGE